MNLATKKQGKVMNTPFAMTVITFMAMTNVIIVFTTKKIKIH